MDRPDKAVDRAAKERRCRQEAEAVAVAVVQNLPAWR